MILGLDWQFWVGIFMLPIWALVGFYGFRRMVTWNNERCSLEAIQRGDPNVLINAPPPESLYDFYIDRITQDFILNQYEKVADRWFRYHDKFGERRAGQRIARLEQMRTRVSLHGDIAKENLRREEFRQKQKELGKEKPDASPEEERRQERLWDDEFTRHERMIVLFDRHNLPPEHEAREKEKNIHEDRQLRIIEGRQLPPL